MVYRSVICGLLFVAALAQPAMAARPWHTVSFQPAVPAPGQPFRIRVEGSMPDTCGVRFEGLSLQRDSLQLQLSRPADRICGEAITPYALEVDASALIGSIAVAGSIPLFVTLDDALGSRDIAFALLTVADPADPVRPEAGFWVADADGRHPTGGSGVGFNLERQQDALALIAYYYDSAGQPRWYFSAGPDQGHAYRGELLQITGGQQLFGSYRPPGDMSAFGNIDLAFQGNGRAEAWFSEAIDGGVLAEIRVQPVSLVRFGFRTGATAEALSGRWVLVDLGRDGGSGRVLDLQPAALNSAAQLRMEDVRAAVVLDCGVIERATDQPPASCSLSVDGARTATLDNNGFDELRSRDGHWRLLRLQD